MSRLPAYWQLFIQGARERDAAPGVAREQAIQLFQEYSSCGCVRRLPGELAGSSDYRTALFFEQLAEAFPERISGSRVVSPVEEEPDSGWMTGSDFCFINVRAVGPDPDRAGNFIDAIKILPMLRVNSIHLAPFFECVFGNVYAVDSLTLINPEVVNAYYLEYGLSPDDQLRLLIDAIHLLGMTVGFDLEPHTSQFSKVVLQHPQFFRWIRLSENRRTLHGRISMDKMLQPGYQKHLAEEVAATVATALRDAGIAGLDDMDVDPAVLRGVHSALVQQLIALGYWTLPSHTWNGVGVPAFLKYNRKGNYPEFSYLDAAGEDQSRHAFGMLTPVAFAEGLLPNKVPDEKSPVTVREECVAFFAEIFPAVRSRFPFDFVRLDYVDHVFDSVLPGQRILPLADRPTPYVLEQVIQKARTALPWIGAMAERMGYDISDYASVGFDLILGADVLRVPDIQFIQDMLRFQQELAQLNIDRQAPVSIQAAIDSHDTGHPEIQADPSLHGVKGMVLRLFLARFGNAGKGRRPKYEVIGNQDLTSGLYEANNRPVSLRWRSNPEMMKWYHGLEDVYTRFKTSIANSYIKEMEFEKEYAVWYIDRSDGFRQRLVCICFPDLHAEKPLEPFSIYPFGQYWFDAARIDAVDLQSGERSFVPINTDGTVTVEGLAPGDVRLLWIREDGTELPEES